MAKSIRIEINRNGVLALLQSAEVQQDLEERAQRMAAAAGGGDDYEVSSTRNRDRVVVFVKTASNEARKEEAENRTLTRSIDAGR